MRSSGMARLTMTAALALLAACGDDAAPAPPDAGLDDDPCTPGATAIIEPVWTAGYLGAAPEVGAFGKADALYLDPNGLLLVGDEDPAYDELALFDVDAVADGVAPPVADLGGWESIGGIAREPSSGDIFVVELRLGRVRIMRWADDPRGAPYLTEVGTLGRPATDLDNPGPGEFVRAQTVEFDSQGRIYVTDDGKVDGATGARDVQVFAPDRTFIERFGRGDLQEPENFVFDEARNRIYVTDEGPRDIAVFRFDDHTLETRIGGFVGIPNGIDVDQYGTLYVMDEDAGQVRVIDPDTLEEVYRFGADSEATDLTPGTFRSPDTLVIDVARDLLIVTDQGHHRVQAFALRDIQARACRLPRELVVQAPPQVRLGSAFTVQVEVQRGGAPDLFPLAGRTARIDAAAAPLIGGVGGVALTATTVGPRVVPVQVGGLTASVTIDVVAPSTRDLTGELTGDDLAWAPADGVVMLTGTTTVPAGATLTIAPGTLVALGPAAVLDVQGDLLAAGTAAAPISIFAADPAAPWATIRHTGGTATYTHAFVAGGSAGAALGHCCTPMLRADGTTLTLDHVVVADTRAKGLYATGGDTVLRDVRFARLAMGAEIDHGGVTRVEGSYFLELTSLDGSDQDNDGLYFHEEGDYRIARSVFAGASDDMLDLEYASAVVQDAVFADATDKAVSINGGSASFTNVLVTGSGIGVGLKNGRPPAVSAPTFARVTFAGNQTGVAVIDGANAMPPIEPTLTSSILWDNDADVASELDPADVTAAYCTIEDAVAITATAVTADDPQFRDPAALDYRLDEGSPAATAAADGGPIGWAGW